LDQVKTSVKFENEPLARLEAELDPEARDEPRRQGCLHAALPDESGVP
jgi:hypothetical protein